MRGLLVVCMLLWVVGCQYKAARNATVTSIWNARKERTVDDVVSLAAEGLQVPYAYESTYMQAIAKKTRVSIIGCVALSEYSQYEAVLLACGWTLTVRNGQLWVESASIREEPEYIIWLHDMEDNLDVSVKALSAFGGKAACRGQYFAMWVRNGEEAYYDLVLRLAIANPGQVIVGHNILLDGEERERVMRYLLSRECADVLKELDVSLCVFRNIDRVLLIIPKTSQVEGDAVLRRLGLKL